MRVCKALGCHHLSWGYTRNLTLREKFTDCSSPIYYVIFTYVHIHTYSDLIVYQLVLNSD
jgi:hypothetical protein